MRWVLLIRLVAVQLPENPLTASWQAFPICESSEMLIHPPRLGLLTFLPSCDGYYVKKPYSPRA